MDFPFPSILYKDSPFLPAVNQDSINNIVADILINRIPSVVAVAKEVGLRGTGQNKIHEDEFDWLEKTFGLTLSDLDNFMFGFITPPALIIGGACAEKYGYPAAIRAICQPTDDELLVLHNRYKAFHLPRAHNMIQNTLDRHPLAGATPIYELCETEIFADSHYYLAGIEASKIHFTHLSAIYDLLLKATPP